VYGSDVLDHQLANLDAAEISGAARAMLPLLDKFTLHHGDLTAEDVSQVRALGIGDEAIIDAFYVAYLFNIINRMSDALRFEIGSQAAFDSSAKSLLGRGYKL
jgi:alkylhydroperoxidase family enzyme